MIVLTSTIYGQSYKFGDVKKTDLLTDRYEIDTSAVAIRLFLNRNTSFTYDITDGWVIVTDIHERIKILNKDGLDYATKKLALYKQNSTRESLGALKGFTYNIKKNKLVKEKLKRNAVFKENQSDNWIVESFTMPDVKVGSIVEWTYRITSPFWKIDDLVIQENIPTLHYFAKIQAHEYFKYNRMVKGGHAVNPRDYNNKRTMKISYEGKENANRHETTGILKEVLATRQRDVIKDGTISFQEFVSEYDLKNIPGLKEEPYVSNIDNYRFIITYELNTVQFPNLETKYYSTTWEKVVKSIYDSDNFGEQLKKVNFLNSDAESIKSLSAGNSEIIFNAYNFVKNKMNWNGNYSKYTELGVQKAYEENIGNVSDINLMLVALLRECGVKTNPVLISTRKHGIPLYPTLEGFNYVVACAELNGNLVLLDATEKMLTPGNLPPRALNWEGTLVLENGESKKIGLLPSKISEYNTIMSVFLSDDGSVVGKKSSNISGLEAYEYRKKNINLSKNEHIESIIEDNNFDDLSNFNIENLSHFNEQVIESYDFQMDEGIDVVGNEIYFSPLFFLKLEENPFKSESRNYPVDFNYTSVQKRIVSIRIPENFKVTSLPKPIKISLPDEMGSFLFNISEVEGGLNILTTFEINSSIIPSFKYFELKEFYNQRVLKETEKVVLTKLLN